MKKILLILFVGFFFIGVSEVYGQSNPLYQGVITGGGGFGNSTHYHLFSLMGSYSTPPFSESLGYLHFDDFFSTTPYLPPIHPRIGVIGTEMTIRGSEFGIKKGKVLLGKIVNNTLKTMSLKVIYWGDDSIRVQLNKIPSTGPGVYDVIIRPAGKGVPELDWENGFTVRALPDIYLIEGESSPGAVRIAKGRFFGTKKPKVNLEKYEGDEKKTMVKSCTVKRWVMHPTTGEGEVEFVMPKKTVPEYDVVGIYPSGVTPDYSKPLPECPLNCPCPDYKCPNRCDADLIVCPAHCDRKIYCQCVTDCGSGW